MGKWFLGIFYLAVQSVISRRKKRKGLLYNSFTLHCSLSGRFMLSGRSMLSGLISVNSVTGTEFYIASFIIFCRRLLFEALLCYCFLFFLNWKSLISTSVGQNPQYFEISSPFQYQAYCLLFQKLDKLPSLQR